MSLTRTPEQALSTVPDYPVKDGHVMMLVTRPLRSKSDDLDQDDSFSSDEDDKDYPLEKRATRKKTRNFPGQHIKVVYTEQMVYDNRHDMKLLRCRHKSDEFKRKLPRLEEPVGDIRRGKSMPVIQQDIQVDAVPQEKSEDVFPLNSKPTFGCGVEDDDFTGLEDEPPLF